MNNISNLAYGSFILSKKLQEDTLKSKELIKHVLDSDINIIDTAYYYGKNYDDIGGNERFLESLLGEKLKELFIATKGGYYIKNNQSVIDNRPEFLNYCCNKSLENLNLKKLFLYQLHVYDKKVAKNIILNTIKELKEKGKILNFGLSNIDLIDLYEFQNLDKISGIYSIQNKLNPFFQKDLKTGLLDYCKDNNILYFAYGIYHKGNNTLLDNLLQSLAKKYNTSSEIITLLWIKSKGSNIIPIISSTKKENINLAISSYKSINLEKEDIEKIDSF
ncbi:MAG: aldo/keto reductase [Candidatus Sericytochromatia bacterium]